MTTASTTVGSRSARAQVIMGSLAWAVLAAFSSSDAVRANQLLVTFQRQWALHGGAVLAGQSAAAQRYRSVPVTGQWEAQTAGALAIALLVVIPSSYSDYGTAQAEALLRTTAAGGVSAAGAIWRTHIMDFAPLGHEAIWRVFDWAQEVAPMDISSHLAQRMEDFVDGLSAAAAPPDAQRAGVPVGTEEVVIQEPINVTAIAPMRAARSYWPWAVAGLGVVALGGVLVWKLGKKRR